MQSSNDMDGDLMARCDEQEKTIQFQKAKIAALQSELEETLQQLAQKEAGSEAPSDRNKAKEQS